MSLTEDALAGGMARVLAPAKVNLLLRVRQRRSDGFHELETVFQAVSLTDAVEVELGGRGVRLEVDGPDLGPAAENLAVRAARAFLDEAGLDVGVRVSLRKEIPAGAGLGGGSSDAAAVLRAMDRLTGSPLSRQELMAAGATLGSDVPFFLGSSPLAAATGRGELLEPLEPLASTELVLVLPPVQVATGAAYAALSAARKVDGRDGGAPSGPGLPPAPSSWDEVRGWLANDFQPVVAGSTPEVARALEVLRDRGGRGALLSGSGAACFAFFPHREGAGKEVAEAISGELGWTVRAVRTLERFPGVEVVPGSGG